MLRALTAILLASVACGGAGCGSSTSSGPAVVAGAPAGDVSEVTGTVTATRGGTPRPLAAGDVISGDDVIETGADGRVSITLRHNQVAWTLGPGKKEQVGASLAWRAPKADLTAAGPTGERSGAAGRHAEREAAETGATANTDVAMAPPAAEPVAAAPMAPGAAPMPPPPPPAPVAAIAQDRAATMADPMPAPKPQDIDDEVQAPRAAKLESAKVATKDDSHSASDDFGSGGLGLTGTGPGGGGSGEGIGLGTVGTLGKGGGAGGGAGYGAGGAGARAAPRTSATVKASINSGPLTAPVVQRIVNRRKAAMLDCAKTEPAVVASAKLLVSKDGSVASSQVAGASDSVNNCIARVLKDVRFPSADAPTLVQVRLETTTPDL